MLFRILTERKNMEGIGAALESMELDYTFFEGQGSWHGRTEYSVAIELARVSRRVAERVARKIKQMNGQDAVLLQEIPVRSDFI